MAILRRRAIGFAVVCALLIPLAYRVLAQRNATAAVPDLKTLARQSLSRIDGELKVSGLKQTVQVVRDRWGVPHIYAQNTDDLFFAQGYVMAQDRLWQMDWWRRSREGRLAEVLGPAALERDRQARLMKYRGALDDAEWTSYHAEGKRIFTAYANGVNAYIQQNANNLPVEFKLTGLKPEPWTAETVILRSPELPESNSFGDAPTELRLAMNVARLGVDAANRLAAPDPWDDLQVPEGLDVKLITDEVLAATRIGRDLPRPEIVEPYQKLLAPTDLALLFNPDRILEPGSNNWVVSGAMSTTGKPVVANDPHRVVANPSVRYIVHLNAPGWNVIGSGEAPFVGVQLGHNEHIAWGLTIAYTDMDDVFVEEVDPGNPNQVMRDGKWEPLKIVREEIGIKGQAARTVELKYSRHGAIFHVDDKNHKAYAVRSVLQEPGTAAYLGALKLDQAKSCKEFLDQAMYWKYPSENLICGDVDGNIAWQASALTPNRRGWVGRLPVPGTGKYEWDGFRKDLPKEYNPSRGFIATANNNTTPSGYWPPAGFRSTNGLELARITRLMQLLKPGQKYSIEDHERMQNDYYSLRAEAELPLFSGWTAKSPEAERARVMLTTWDKMLRKDSPEAALFMTWASGQGGGRGAGPAAGAAQGPGGRGGRSSADVEARLEKAVEQLTKEQGADWRQWQYGRIHQTRLPHPLIREFALPDVERGGGGGTVGADGASYREIIDVSDWDHSVVTQVPGESAQPDSPFYANLLPLWANNEYFSLVFGRGAVDTNAAHRLTLQPAAK
jgi:penicillin amidase